MRLPVLFLLFINLYTIYGDLNGSNCHLDGVEDREWLTSFENDEIPDTERVIFKQFMSANVTGVSILSTSDYFKYFAVRYENNSVFITPSSEFAQFEINEPSGALSTKMLVNLQFSCSQGTATLLFFQPVKDVNTDQPKFQQSEYKSILPMPLPPGFDISCIFKDRVVACDNDISTLKLAFGIEPEEEFSIEWESYEDSKQKCHRALVKTSGPVSLTETKTYTLTVNDLGDSPMSSTADLVIEVNETASIPQSPQFASAYYTGNYNTDDQGHQVSFDTIITIDSVASGIKFDLLGEHKDNFELKYSNGEVIVTLQTNLADDVLENNVIVLLTIEATVENAISPGRTVLVVYLPKTICPEVTTQEPTQCTTESTTLFTCPPCTTDQPESTQCPTCETCTTITESSLSPTSSCPPCESSTITECTTDCPPCSTPSTECPTVATEPTIHPPSTECPTTWPEPTECPDCSSTPSTEWPTTCPEPTECPDYSSTPSTECPTTCPGPTECPDCSSTPSTECPTTCPEPTECPDCSSTPSTNCPSTCPDIPECPPCTSTSSTEGPSACPEPTGCPPCPTTPNPTDPAVTFEQDNYLFNIPSIELVTVGIVKADTTILENVEYFLEPISGGTLPAQLRINQNNGILSVKEKLEIGQYEVQVRAKGMISTKEDVANVFINVMGAVHSVLVTKVDEGSENTIDMPCPEGQNSCSYKMIKTYPTVTNAEELFSVKNNKLSVADLDLHMDEIKNLAVPQFTLTLELIGTSNRKSSNKTTNVEDDSYELVLLPEILPNRPNVLMVSVIINDVNEKPQFKEDKLTVGYPKSQISDQLVPNYLVQVQATDSDLLPANSDIRYSTDSQNFIIHPKTGVIYIGKTNFNDGETFIVTATDNDGAASGLSTTLQIEVVPLEQKHLTVMEVKNKVLEDIDGILESLSNDLNLKIRHLTASVVPDEDTRTERIIRQIKRALNNFGFRAMRDGSHSVSMVIYAFAEENEVMNSEDLRKILADSNPNEDIITDTWIPPTGNQGGGDDYNNTTGLKVGIGVLGSLLAIFIVGIGLLYFFKIYKPRQQKPYDAMDNEDSISVQSKQDSDISKRRATAFEFNPPPTEDNDDTASSNYKYEEVDSTIKPDLNNSFSAPSYVETVNYTKSLNENNQIQEKVSFPNYSPPPPKYTADESDDEDLRDQKKSVSFLPTVQKINIPVDVDESDLNIRL